MSEDTLKNITEAQGAKVVKFLMDNTTRAELAHLLDKIEDAIEAIYKAFPELREENKDDRQHS